MASAQCGPACFNAHNSLTHSNMLVQFSFWYSSKWACSLASSSSSCYHTFRVLQHCHHVGVLSFSLYCAPDCTCLFYLACKCHCSFPIWELNSHLYLHHLPLWTAKTTPACSLWQQLSTYLGPLASGELPFLPTTCAQQQSDNSWSSSTHLMLLWEKAGSLVFCKPSNHVFLSELEVKHALKH